MAGAGIIGGKPLGDVNRFEGKVGIESGPVPLHRFRINPQLNSQAAPESASPMPGSIGIRLTEQRDTRRGNMPKGIDRKKGASS